MSELGHDQRDAAPRPRVCVFAPAPLLTVSAEAATDAESDAELHVHAGGQGFWVCRLLEALDVEAVMCASFGGETGTVLRTLIDAAGVRVVAVSTVGSNGAYVHDRRGGEREVVATMAASPLSRHEVDDLYDVTLIEALASTVTVLTGPQEDVVPDDMYRRLALDARRNARFVVADLSGGRLEAALEGGLDLLKVSDEELESDGRLSEAGSLTAAIDALVAAGAANVVVTRGDQPTMASINGRRVRVERAEPRGRRTEGRRRLVHRGDGRRGGPRANHGGGADTGGGCRRAQRDPSRACLRPSGPHRAARRPGHRRRRRRRE